MSKNVLEFEYEFEYDIVGISCHMKDYRLAWQLNKTFKIDLSKQNDFELILKDEKQFFSYFKFDDETNESTYHLLNNRTENGLLIPERKEIDYIFCPVGFMTDVNKYLDKIRKLDMVLTAFAIDPNQLKSKENIILD